MLHTPLYACYYAFLHVVISILLYVTAVGLVVECVAEASWSKTDLIILIAIHNYVSSPESKCPLYVDLFFFSTEVLQKCFIRNQDK